MVFGKEFKNLKEIDKASLEYLKQKRNKFEDLTNFIEFLKKRHPPKTLGVYLPAVKEWLAINNYEPSPREKRILKKLTPTAKPRSEEEILTKDKIRKILTYLPLHGKALVLLLASSGMRVGEALSLELEDVKLDEEPVRIVIRQEITKSQTQRTTFISSEAREVLKEWLKHREDYLKAARNKNIGLVKQGRAGIKSREDRRVFPFSFNVANQFWWNALDKAGLNGRDRATRRRKYRIHGLRKFFRTELARVIPVDVVEALMGHEGYLSQSYRKYTVEELREYYKKGEHVLLITPPEDVVKVAFEVREDLNKNRKLLEDLIIENKDLKEKIAKLEKVNKNLEQRIKKLENVSLTKEEIEFLRFVLERVSKHLDKGEKVVWSFVKEE